MIVVAVMQDVFEVGCLSGGSAQGSSLSMEDLRSGISFLHCNNMFTAPRGWWGDILLYLSPSPSPFPSHSPFPSPSPSPLCAIEGSNPGRRSSSIY